MDFNRDNILNRTATSKKAVVMDEGLRAYMLKVYNYMATGVCLLYTSPSPRDKRQSRMPSSA